MTTGLTRFYRRAGIPVLLAALISLPWLLYGAQQVVSHNYNDVTEWLPDDNPATTDLLWFVEHFGGDDRDESLPHYYGRWGTEENRARIDAIRAGSITDKMPMTEAAEVEDDAYRDGRNTTSAIRTLGRAVDSGQPFFLAVGYSAPHSPFTAPKKYWDFYDPAALSLDDVRDQSLDMPEANFLTDADETTFYEVPGIRADGSVPLETARHLRHGYLASVSYMDAQIGRLLDALDAQGVADETLVVLWSDHGFHLGERAHWGKRTLYDLDVRAPLIVARPAVTSGRVASGLVESRDIFPTLCEWAELEKPDYLEGESFADLLREPKTPGKDAVYFRAPRPAPLPSGQAVRTATHTYAEWIDPQGQTVLRQLIAHGGDGSMEITTLHPGEKSPLIESLAQCLRPAPPLHEE